MRFENVLLGVGAHVPCGGNSLPEYNWSSPSSQSLRSSLLLLLRSLPVLPTTLSIVQTMSAFAGQIPALRTCLLDLSQPVGKRTHAAFLLRTNASEEAVSALLDALEQRQDSSLMRHEIAYILGQVGNTSACASLTSVLSDEADDVLVRHEAAEALGAIGQLASIPTLSKYCDHPAREIRETCQIAVDLIKWRATGESVSKSSYLSVDPAPPLQEQTSVVTLRDDLIDTSKSLFLRYRVMFTLRDMNSDEAALALVAGFSDDSALFRHEIAYVLGQMQRPVTVPGLTKVLENTAEHRMVRHEAAEALGSIGGEEVERLLKLYQHDNEEVVKESCDVALDTMEYWTAM